MECLSPVGALLERMEKRGSCWVGSQCCFLLGSSYPGICVSLRENGELPEMIAFFVTYGFAGTSLDSFMKISGEAISSKE